MVEVKGSKTVKKNLTIGEYLLDTQGTPKTILDPNNRILYEADGVTKVLDFSSGMHVGDTGTGYNLPLTDGNPGDGLKTDGVGTVSWGKVGDNLFMEVFS